MLSEELQKRRCCLSLIVCPQDSACSARTEIPRVQGFHWITSSPATGSNKAVKCEMQRWPKHSPDFPVPLCVVHSKNRAFWSGAILGIACCYQDWSLVLWSRAGVRPRGWGESNYFPTYRVPLPLKERYLPTLLSVGGHTFQSPFSFIHLIIISTWHEIFQIWY